MSPEVLEMEIKKSKRIFQTLIVCLIFLEITARTGHPKAETDGAVGTSRKATIFKRSADAAHCKALNGMKGEQITEPSGSKKSLKKTKSEDLADSGLPKAVLAEISDILDSWAKDGKGAKSESGKPIFQDETNKQPDGKLPKFGHKPVFAKDIAVDLATKKRISSAPDCIPRIGRKLRRRKRSVKKNCRIVYVWPSHHKKKPFCDEYFKNNPGKKPKEGAPSEVTLPPAHKNAATFKIEILEDDKGIYWFKFTVTGIQMDKNVPRFQEFKQGDTFLILPEWKIPSGGSHKFVYPMYKLTDFDDVEAFNMKKFDELEKLQHFDTIITLVWKKTTQYMVSNVILNPIEELFNLCSGLPWYLDYLQHMDERAQESKTTGLLIKWGSRDYEKLFGKKSHFTFQNWYDLYLKIIVGGNFGGEKFGIVESVVETGQPEAPRLQNITVIWDPLKGNLGKVDLGISFPTSGVTHVEMAIEAGKGQSLKTDFQVGVQRLEYPWDPLQPQVLDTYGLLTPNLGGITNDIDGQIIPLAMSIMDQGAEAAKNTGSDSIMGLAGSIMSRSLGADGKKSKGRPRGAHPKPIIQKHKKVGKKSKT